MTSLLGVLIVFGAVFAVALSVGLLFTLALLLVEQIGGLIERVFNKVK